MTVTQKTPNGLSRRNVLAGALAGGFMFAFHMPVRAANEPTQPPDTTDGKFAPNAFIRIDTTGKTTLVMPQVEMGQGIYTSIAMILAEELDADYSQITLQHAPPSDKLYGNPIFIIQATGGSTSVRAFWKPLRNAGATARAMLVQAAAEFCAGHAENVAQHPEQRHVVGCVERFLFAIDSEICRHGAPIGQHPLRRNVHNARQKVVWNEYKLVTVISRKGISRLCDARRRDADVVTRYATAIAGNGATIAQVRRFAGRRFT